MGFLRMPFGCYHSPNALIWAKGCKRLCWGIYNYWLLYCSNLWNLLTILNSHLHIEITKAPKGAFLYSISKEINLSYKKHLILPELLRLYPDRL